MLTFDEAVEVVMGFKLQGLTESNKAWLERNKELITEATENSRVQQLLWFTAVEMYRIATQQSMVIVPMNQVLEMISNLTTLFTTGMMVGREMEKSDLEGIVKLGGEGNEEAEHGD